LYYKPLPCKNLPEPPAKNTAPKMVANYDEEDSEDAWQYENDEDYSTEATAAVAETGGGLDWPI
jgi:hypothetical protein